jgi:hypothetical protein
VWEYGGIASKGLGQVAKWGSTRELESELKAESSHIRRAQDFFIYLFIKPPKCTLVDLHFALKITKVN